jgi:hypothetical protein
VHTVVVAPSVAITVTCSERLVAVGAVVTPPRERLYTVGVAVTPRERVLRTFPPSTEVGMSPTETERRFDAATERQITSVQVEVGPPLLVEMVTGVANVVAD